MKIYVASSWRNPHQPNVVHRLRAGGHEVYDFRHPGEGQSGFSWSEIDPDWQAWTVTQFVQGLKHPRAKQAFQADFNALEWCELCLLVLPSGMSAHLEAGWCAGRGRPVVVYAPEVREAELMYGIFILGDEFPVYDTIEGALGCIAKLNP